MRLDGRLRYRDPIQELNLGIVSRRKRRSQLSVICRQTINVLPGVIRQGAQKRGRARRT